MPLHQSICIVLKEPWVKCLCVSLCVWHDEYCWRLTTDLLPVPMPDFIITHISSKCHGFVLIGLPFSTYALFFLNVPSILNFKFPMSSSHKLTINHYVKSLFCVCVIAESLLSFLLPPMLSPVVFILCNIYVYMTGNPIM